MFVTRSTPGEKGGLLVIVTEAEVTFVILTIECLVILPAVTVRVWSFANPVVSTVRLKEPVEEVLTAVKLLFGREALIVMPEMVSGVVLPREPITVMFLFGMTELFALKSR